MTEIYIEGNIGTGKTTFLTWLEHLYPHDSVVYEPVDQWLETTDSDNTNILDKFYSDQKRWSFTFQMNSFISRIKVISDAPKTKIKFIERSVFTDKICFAQNCYKNGKMTQLEYGIYDNWHRWLCEKFDIKPRYFIYLRTTPEISDERIKTRSRDEESGIPLDYLRQLHQLHEDWMEDNSKKGIKVLVLDVSINFYRDEKEKKKIIGLLYDFIQPSQPE
tara:strand:+ start:225 stop:881 length:657 start_codon:yes stop_codon:yes gene_type:complete